jgi:hypothetical protein
LAEEGEEAEDPPPKKRGRPGYKTEEERRAGTLAKHRRYNDKRRRTKLAEGAVP